MDDLKSLNEKVNLATEYNSIFYITNDAERAFGLELLLKNYHILSIDDNQYIDYLIHSGANIYSLERITGKQNTIFRNSNKLLQRSEVIEYIKSKSKDSFHLMVFKPAPNIERTTERIGGKLLNTSAALNRKYENKISQYESLSTVARFPKTLISLLHDVEYDALKNEFELPFIVQFDQGHTGTSTYIVNDADEFNNLAAKFSLRKARIVKYIPGEPYTINACITRFGVAMGGLSYQITGVKECTENQSATVGNDWDIPKYLSENVKKQIISQAENIGNEMAKNGYKGMFGLDLIVDGEEVFTIEVNARQTASISTHSKLQIKNNQIPLNLLAISEFLNIDFEIDIENYNIIAMNSINASQLIIRSKSSGKLMSDIKPGIYRLQSDNSAFDWKSGSPRQKEHVIYLDEEKDKPLIFQHEAYAVDQINSPGILITSVKEGRSVSQNSEIARLQSIQSFFDKDRNLLPWVREIAASIKSNLLIT